MAAKLLKGDNLSRLFFGFALYAWAYRYMRTHNAEAHECSTGLSNSFQRDKHWLALSIFPYRSQSLDASKNAFSSVSVCSALPSRASVTAV